MAVEIPPFFMFGFERNTNLHNLVDVDISPAKRFAKLMGYRT